MGVLQTTVAELVTVKEHQRKTEFSAMPLSRLLCLARSFSIMPFVWCLGYAKALSDRTTKPELS